MCYAKKSSLNLIHKIKYESLGKRDHKGENKFNVCTWFSSLEIKQLTS